MAEKGAAWRAPLLAILRDRAVRWGSFVLASGRTSDLYVDVKSIFLDPDGLDLIAAAMIETAREAGLDFGAVGGMSLGADPLVSAFVLRSFDRGRPVPGFLARKEAKGHGTSRLLEGAAGLPPDTPVLILEDVVTSGGSSLRTAEIARGGGLRPVGVLTLIDREEGGREAIESAGLSFVPVLGRRDLMPENGAIAEPG